MTASTKAHVDCKSSTVIVVEKYPIARAALAALLTQDGYRVFQAENVGAAISRIDTADDLGAVLVDLDMPGWKSVIRRAGAKSRAWLIAMQGNHYVAKDELERRGVQVCLQKPIIYDDVRLTLGGYTVEPNGLRLRPFPPVSYPSAESN